MSCFEGRNERILLKAYDTSEWSKRGKLQEWIQLCILKYIELKSKIKEQEIEDTYHQTHLKEMKPLNKKLMQHSETIIINHGKRQMINQVREIQIERQNKLLLQKISDVMGKKGAYSVAKTKNIRTKVNKSLNQIYRKRQLQNIQTENKRFLQRLQTKRPTLNLQKMNKEWVQNKSIIKRITNADFYLANIHSASRMRSITTQKFNKSKYDNMKLVKTKVIDRHKILVKIQFVGEILKIIGDPQDKSNIKIIQIPRDQAITLIQKDCQGKFQLLLDKLKYEAESQTLYIVSENYDDQEVNFSEFNPEMEKIMNITQSNKKKVINQERNDKTAPIRGKTNQSVKQQAKKSIEIENKSGENKIQEKQKIQEIVEKPTFSKQKIRQINQSQVQVNKQALIEQKAAEKYDLRDALNQNTQIMNQQIQIKEDHIAKQLVKVQPQEVQKYQEQNFEQPIPNQEQVEPPNKQIVEKPQAQSKQIIVEPQSAQNYNEQFQVSGQAVPQKIAQLQQEING